MEYKVKMYLRMQWLDPRLAYAHRFDRAILNIDSQLFDRFWVPDVFFINEKEGEYHKVTTPNKLIRIYPNGTITSSMRLTLVLQCPMDLHDYPLDNQACPMELESYAYDKTEIDFHWAEYEPVQINEDIGKLDTVPEFTLTRVHKEKGEYHYTLGDWASVKLTFFFERRLGYYMMAAYFPSIITVILSWVAFWIDPHAVPARICIGFLTVLTAITQSAGIRNSLPRVSYIKAVDIWMVTCLVYVAAALVEYAICHAVLISYTGFITICRQKKKSTDNGTEKPSESNENQEKAEYETSKTSFQARRIDEIARVVFPLSFVLFNLVYWIYYNLHCVSATVKDPDLG